MGLLSRSFAGGLQRAGQISPPSAVAEAVADKKEARGKGTNLQSPGA